MNPNPYSTHNLQGEAAFLEQLAQTIQCFDITVSLMENGKAPNIEMLRKMADRQKELYRLRCEERLTSDRRERHLARARRNMVEANARKRERKAAVRANPITHCDDETQELHRCSLPTLCSEDR